MKQNLRLIFGILFVAIGSLIVLETLNFLSGVTGNIIWGAIFGAASVYLFILFRKRRENWWWLILGLIALSFSFSNLTTLVPALSPFSPLVALFGAGIGFFYIYILDSRQWWVFIPGSILLSIGVDELLQITSPDQHFNGTIFFGLGIAFLLLYLIPSSKGKMNWAILPVVIFLLIGSLSSFEQGNQALQITGPVLLLLAGAAVLYYSFSRK